MTDHPIRKFLLSTACPTPFVAQSLFRNALQEVHFLAIATFCSSHFLASQAGGPPVNDNSNQGETTL